MNKVHIEKVLTALADATRRQILDVLATEGQATATILATKVTVSRQAVVKHLTILNKAGLVSCQRIRREMRQSHIQYESHPVSIKKLGSLLFTCLDKCTITLKRFHREGESYDA